jgi:hypothetical protein
MNRPNNSASSQCSWSLYPANNLGPDIQFSVAELDRVLHNGLAHFDQLSVIELQDIKGKEGLGHQIRLHLTALEYGNDNGEALPRFHTSSPWGLPILMVQVEAEVAGAVRYCQTSGTSTVPGP